ncbi:flagellar basal body P-ring formation protein FlgA [candidate division KSB1 bacterium]|nr:flagellar basal body P-ring formation protein FlgA [candidate division KSB1 bacterium]
MIARFVIVLAGFGTAAFADAGSSVIEALIAREWQPLTATVEWASTGALPLSVAAQDDWTLAVALPHRPCGSLIVQLERKEFNHETRRVSVSGNCRVRVDAFTVARQIAAGQPLTPEDLIPVTMDWKPAYGEPIQPGQLTPGIMAARALIPGRPVCHSDLKRADLIQPGQRVSMHYESGTVRVTIPGRALAGGAPGDLIQAATYDSPSKTYQGRIQPDGHVQISF